MVHGSVEPKRPVSKQKVLQECWEHAHVSFSNSLTIVVRAHALPSARPFFEFRYAVADLNLTFHERVSVLPLLDLNPQKMSCTVL